MRDTFLPFSKPCITEAEIAAVGDVLRSGWITTGPKGAQFESDLKAYTGAADVVCMTSETSVMQTLARAIDLGPGDEVITPSMTWVSMVNITALSGATPVFVDCDRDTLMITAEAIEKAITPRTKLIVPVHFAGAILDMDKIRAVAAKHNIMLVEDAAHALGGAYKGEKVGKKGHAMFSFHPIKNITTGEGGMFATDDQALADRMRSLKFHGLGVDAYDRQTHGRAPQAQVVEPGFKFNLPDMQAVLGIGQLARVDEMNRKRGYIMQQYAEKLNSIDEIIQLKQPDYEFTHAHHLMVVRLDINKAAMSRDDFMSELKKRNIGTGLHFRCVHLQKYYREAFNCAPGMLPDTEWNSERILSLPMFPDMTDQDIDDVVAAIKDILKK
ncbi:MAG: UDP-4-amino-4-deoxy-L-arabinose aminotransferase [Lentisphaerae bacterium]|nr:UDP-4-amino-4-deoxy-L-arabinose aminotransferase [Lentisphaerota bacterium]